MTTRLIELNGLTKRFGSGSGSILAVSGVSFSVSPGEVLGFLGPNGAGKSTTMKMVTGYLTPTSGSPRCAGSTWRKRLWRSRAASGICRRARRRTRI